MGIQTGHGTGTPKLSLCQKKKKKKSPEKPPRVCLGALPGVAKLHRKIILFLMVILFPFGGGGGAEIKKPEGGAGFLQCLNSFGACCEAVLQEPNGRLRSKPKASQFQRVFPSSVGNEPRTSSKLSRRVGRTWLLLHFGDKSFSMLPSSPHAPTGPCKTHEGSLEPLPARQRGSWK